MYLASKYNTATEDDYGKAMRIAEYIVGCGDNHCLILAPKSLQHLLRDPMPLTPSIKMGEATPEAELASRVTQLAGLCGLVLSNP